MVGRWDGRARIVVGLALHRQAAALGVVETGDALLEHRAFHDVVVERVGGACSDFRWCERFVEALMKLIELVRRR